MHFESLSITNFRAIKSFEIEDLKDMVVIAGPNGCGKSAVLHALRLLKSAYGGYTENEIQQWFNEFDINLKVVSQDFARLFRDPTESLHLEAKVTLADAETEYLRSHGEKLLEARAWNEIAPRAVNWRPGERARLTPDLKRYEDRVKARTQETLESLVTSLQKAEHTLVLEVGLDDNLETSPSPAIELLFATYDPANLGIFDYHADTRQYNRGSRGNLNVNFSGLLDRRSQQALYQTQQKYQNLRADLLTSYLTGLIRKDANGEDEQSDAFPDLLASVKELFRSFFPGKEFVGPVPQPDGTVDFPVRLSDGSTHDIADLSAGEQEIVFGYLRLHGLNPHNSVLLFDEPELHLNPRLMSGLAEFYSRHLGAIRRNQIWMTTHSDTLLRESIGKPGYSVYHMRDADFNGTNQAVGIKGKDELQEAIIAIVGDLAAYQPGRPLLILEGGGEDEFDARMVQRLFPKVAAGVNLVSGGNKQRVKHLHALLGNLRKKQLFPYEVFGIVDRDLERSRRSDRPTNTLQWDRYHIENYLLDDKFVLEALHAVGVSKLSKEADVGRELHACACRCLDKMVSHELREYVSAEFWDCVDLKGDPSEDPVTVLERALQRSFSRLEEARSDVISSRALEAKRADIRKRLESDLRSSSWRETFKGRSVLKLFVGKHCEGIGYKPFRNLILDKMAIGQFQPPGMKKVLDSLTA